MKAALYIEQNDEKNEWGRFIWRGRNESGIRERYIM